MPDGEEQCPRCRQNHTVPTHPVEVAGVKVPVAALIDFGRRDGLLDREVRRGLDVLQAMRINPQLTVQIAEEDYPQIREVDLKLIELARHLDAKIVTNDFNLNKVAQVRGVPVLNINDLANSLRPVVLPGEKMHILVMKEGKEYDQGVGYLDDGTMVVVDHARRLIGRAVDISVTSVLQTASGKMIYAGIGNIAGVIFSGGVLRRMVSMPGTAGRWYLKLI